MCCGSTGGTIQFNEVADNSSENAAIYLYSTTNMTIQCNTVYDVYNNDGIKFGSKKGADAANTGGSILNNTVFDTAQDGIAVYMGDTLVEGNDVSYSTSENGAIYVARAVSNVTIQNNDVHDNTLNAGKWGDPGAIMIGTEVDTTTTVVNNNNITGNTVNGLTNKAVAPLNGEDNWWGAVDGPSGSGFGAGDAVSTNVAFTPFLTAPQVIPDACAPPLPEDLLDHYQCYEVVGEAVDELVDLKDQFSDDIIPKVATTPRFLCAPVDKNGEGFIDEETHLTCYDVVESPSESVNKDVAVSNQFGPDQLLSVQQPKTLCVPSTKVVIGDTPVPPVPPASCADGKPKELVFKYTGGSCGGTNSQDGKFKCSGDSTGASPVEIVVSGKDASKLTVLPGTVSAGDSFSVASNNGRKLPGGLKLEVRQGGITLQKLEVHASCSKSLDIDDVFGSLTLLLFVPE